MLGLLPSCALFVKPPVQVEVKRDLPPLPAYVAPVRTPDPKPGDDPVIVAARERAAKAHANCVIKHFRSWYWSIRQAYEAGEPFKAAVTSCKKG